MATKKTLSRKPARAPAGKPTTPVTVSIGPIPEWNHIGISSMVPGKRLMLVPSQDTDCVSVVDLEGFYVATTVQLPKGSGPWHVKATPDGRRALVSYSRFKGHIEHTDRKESAVGVIDIKSGKLVGEVPVMSGPVMIEMDDRRNRAYVTNRFSNTFSVIDLRKLKVIENVKTGAAPFWVTMSPKRDVLVVGNFEEASIGIYDPDTFECRSTVPVGTPLEKPFPEFGLGDTLGISITSDGIAYVANWRSHTIARVDVYQAQKEGRRAVLGTDTSVKFPFHVELDERNRLMVVGSYDVPDNRLVVFDLQDGRSALGERLADVPVSGTARPSGRAAEVNYWMSQPFEARIVGYLGRGIGGTRPIDLVAAVL